VIPKTRLPKSSIVTSRLGFGTSRLHHIDLRSRKCVLSAALDLGFVHFDTAPSYGDGLAEIELGLLMRGCRDRVVLATKYGIPPDPILAMRPDSSVLRGMRVVARKAGLWGSPLPPLSPEGLQASLEGSLRRLNTTWIDIILLHAPSLERLNDAGRMEAALEVLKTKGVVRAYGLAGSWQEINAIRKLYPGLAKMIQTSELEWPPDDPPQITYGAIANGKSQSWRQPRLESGVAIEAVMGALRRRHEGCLLISSTRPDNLRAIAETIAGEN
jgi:D-threo-aldose 1-dehydrogenase